MYYNVRTTESELLIFMFNHEFIMTFTFISIHYFQLAVDFYFRVVRVPLLKSKLDIVRFSRKVEGRIFMFTVSVTFFLLGMKTRIKIILSVGKKINL